MRTGCVSTHHECRVTPKGTELHPMSTGTQHSAGSSTRPHLSLGPGFTPGRDQGCCAHKLWWDMETDRAVCGNNQGPRHAPPPTLRLSKELGTLAWGLLRTTHMPAKQQMGKSDSKESSRHHHTHTHPHPTQLQRGKKGFTPLPSSPKKASW